MEQIENNFHRILGDINAENDDLLFECRVEKSRTQLTKEILTGRWGTGKTAQVLLQNEQQIKLLENIDPTLKLVWYISERKLINSQIVEMYDSYKENTYRFESILANMWKAEILRVYIIVLVSLRDNYPKIDSQNWKDLMKISSTKNIMETASKYLTDIVKIIFRGSDESIQNLNHSLNVLLDEKTFNLVRSCLLSLMANGYKIPQVVIEPIETPDSSFEKNRGLADSVVRSLIDVFQSEFYPHAENPFKVRLVIPWHRLNTDIKFPQKLTDYRGTVTWKKDELQEFICRRIVWEFNRVGRKFGKPNVVDAWKILFDEKIGNGLTDPMVLEDSFDYFLRHTHYRSRDLINLCKVCIAEVLDETNEYRNEDDVLKRGYINKEVIKNAIRKFNTRATNELLSESRRKYKNIQPVFEALKRLPIPFTYNELNSRIVKQRLDLNVESVIDELWESGILGITILTSDPEIDKTIGIYYPDSGRKSYDKYMRWTWFFYNCDFKPQDIMLTLESMGAKDFGFTYHPKTFEYFIPTTRNVFVPVGV